MVGKQASPTISYDNIGLCYSGSTTARSLSVNVITRVGPLFVIYGTRLALVWLLIGPEPLEWWMSPFVYAPSRFEESNE